MTTYQPIATVEDIEVGSVLHYHNDSAPEPIRCVVTNKWGDEITLEYDDDEIEIISLDMIIIKEGESFWYWTYGPLNDPTQYDRPLF